jgi:hypothetical protein
MSVAAKRASPIVNVRVMPFRVRRAALGVNGDVRSSSRCDWQNERRPLGCARRRGISRAVQRIIDCHLARNAVSHERANASRSPLDVEGTTITVSVEPGTLTINVATNDHQAAREVLARARTLVPPR